MRGWGLDRWGLSPFGGIVDTSIQSAYPIGPRIVRVELTAPPLDLTPWRLGNVRCAPTWQLVELTPTLRYPTGNRTILILGVSEARAPLIWDLHTLDPLGQPSNTHRLRTDTLKNTAGILLVAPRQFFFHGIQAVNQRDKPQRQLITVDVKNSSVFGQGQAWTNTTGGSLTLESGPSGLRKRIYRILTTKPGTWANDPTFGVGFSVKAPMPTGSLPALQRLIEEQVGRDPEVVGVRCGLSMRAEGILFVSLAVQGRFFTDQVEFESSPDKGLVMIGSEV